MKIHAIQIHIDKFTFVEAKKYLALKGPLRSRVIHDDMYPLLKFDTEIIIKKPNAGIRAGKLACYWYNGRVHPCLITQVFKGREFKVTFLKGGSPTRIFAESQFLGEIISPKISVWWQFKLWRLKCRC